MTEVRLDRLREILQQNPAKVAGGLLVAGDILASPSKIVGPYFTIFLDQCALEVDVRGPVEIHTVIQLRPEVCEELREIIARRVGGERQ